MFLVLHPVIVIKNMLHSAVGKRWLAHIISTIEHTAEYTCSLCCHSLWTLWSVSEWMSDFLDWMPLNMQLFSVAYTYNTSPGALGLGSQSSVVTHFASGPHQLFKNNYLVMHWLSWEDITVELRKMRILSVDKWRMSPPIYPNKTFDRN